MGVNVHETGRDNQAGGVNDTAGITADIAHGGNFALPDTDIPPVGRHTQTIDNRAVFNQYIILGHNSPPCVVVIA